LQSIPKDDLSRADAAAFAGAPFSTLHCGVNWRSSTFDEPVPALRLY
jgi:hypothetical protein